MFHKRPCPPFIRGTQIIRIDNEIFAAVKKNAAEHTARLGRHVSPGEVIEDALIPHLSLKIETREASDVRAEKTA